MQVEVTGGGVSGISHIADHLPLLHFPALVEIVGIAVQVGVVVAGLAVVVQVVDGQAAKAAIVEFEDLPVRYRDDRGATGRMDVDGVVGSAPRNGLPCRNHVAAPRARLHRDHELTDPRKVAELGGAHHLFDQALLAVFAGYLGERGEFLPGSRLVLASLVASFPFLDLLFASLNLALLESVRSWPAWARFFFAWPASARCCFPWSLPLLV